VLAAHPWNQQSTPRVQTAKAGRCVLLQTAGLLEKAFPERWLPTHFCCPPSAGPTQVMFYGRRWRGAIESMMRCRCPAGLQDCGCWRCRPRFSLSRTPVRRAVVGLEKVVNTGNPVCRCGALSSPTGDSVLYQLYRVTMTRRVDEPSSDTCENACRYRSIYYAHTHTKRG
jgi:hypothetical protein